MDIHKIENLSFEELKTRKAELLETLKAASGGDLAVRYLQARTDAKQRDEKLAEQGKTIAHLDELLATVKQQGEEFRAKLTLANDSLKTVRESARQTTLADKTAMGEIVASLKTTAARADRLKVEAIRYHSAVADAAKLLNDALASTAVDNADKGE